MEIRKYGNMLFLTLDIVYDKILLVSNYSEDSDLAESMIGSAIDSVVEIVDPEVDESETKKLMERITKELKREGWYFENPEKFYKRCALCGRKYTYKEATTKDKLCCSSGSYIIPEWKKAEDNTLRNVRVFKIQKGPSL